MDEITLNLNELKTKIKETTDNMDATPESIKSTLSALNKIISVIENQKNISLPKYTDLSIDEVEKQTQKLIGLWKAFILANDSNLNDDDIDINERNLVEVLERVNKRKYHYEIFHNIKDISELREIALICFWLIKLKPFTVLDNDSPLRNSPNEYFCVYLIMCIIEYLTSEKGVEFKPPTDIFIKDTIYIMKYRELSKEAIILLVNSIAQNYGINVDSFL